MSTKQREQLRIEIMSLPTNSAGYKTDDLDQLKIRRVGNNRRVDGGGSEGGSQRSGIRDQKPERIKEIS